MIPLPIPFRTNPGLGQDARTAKVLNAYAEFGDEEGKSRIRLLPVAGMKPFGTENGTGCRGMMYLEDESLLYAVQGARLFKVEEDKTITSLGFIAGSKPPFMARNDADNQQIVIVSEGKAYVVEQGVLTSKRYTQTIVNDDGTETEEVLNFSGVAYAGGYFMFWLDNGKFYVSDLQSTEVNSLQFATAEGDPDGLTAIHGTVNSAYLIGPDTIEVWSITGQEFPFRRVSGAHLQFGSRSPHTIKDFNNAVVMVCSDNVVRLVSGYSYKDISSKEVSDLIEAEEDKSNLVGFTHIRGENKFYVLQGTGWTREYNAATGFWSTRGDVFENQWHCIHHARAWNKDIYGDLITGQLFEGDYNLFTDDSKPLAWGFDTPLIHDAPNGLAFASVDIDVETGQGLPGNNPAFLMLSYSDDNGRTFPDLLHLSLGKQGEYNTRVQSHELSQCDEKGRIFKLRITDPVIRSIHGFYADAERVEL